jgi:hypothetical protein
MGFGQGFLDQQLAMTPGQTTSHRTSTHGFSYGLMSSARPLACGDSFTLPAGIGVWPAAAGLRWTLPSKS